MEPTDAIFGLANEHIRAMEAYTPGEQPQGEGWTKLNTNELPYPPGEKVVAAIHAALGEDGDKLRLYPQPTSQALREKIAAQHGLSPENVIAGNGSDDLLNILLRTFSSSERPAGRMRPSYSLYPVLAAVQNTPMREVPFGAGMELDTQAIINSGANLFFLTSPNAPTGIGFSNTTIRQILDGYPGLLVVDEAYGAFAEETAADLLAEYPRLVVTRTFSKSHGLAGLRVGYALAHPAIISLLDRVRDSYNLDRVAQAAALAALEDAEYFASVRDKVVATRTAFIAEARRRGWETYESQANFVFTAPKDKTGHSGDEVAQSLFASLKSQKVLVRYFGKDALTKCHLRVSIGTDSQMATFWKATDTWLSKSA